MLTENQREMRRLGIGGSDVGAILGYDPFKTSLDVYKSKVLPLEAETPTLAMTLGNDAEGRILSWYAYHTGASLEYPPTLFHPQKNYLFANVDAFDSVANRVIEAKRVSWKKKDLWGTPGTDEMPTQYLLQVAHYCSIFEAEQAHIIVEWGEMSSEVEKQVERNKWQAHAYSIYVYKRDPELESLIQRKCDSFWKNHVLTLTPPKPHTADDVLFLWPRHKSGQMREATKGLANDIEQLKALKLQAKLLEEKIDLYETNIKNYIGECEGLMYNNKVIITWKNAIRKSLNTTQLAKDYPEIYEQYVNESQTRYFRVK